jgi:hypothetical protein
MYRLAGGPWMPYSVPVTAQPMVLVEAKNVSTNTTLYLDSAVSHTTYYALVPAMSGTVAAMWNPSSGPSGMVSSRNNTNPDSVVETDGTAASGSGITYNGANTFTFNRVSSFANVAPNTPFKIGTLTYHNGTIWSGTGATGLDLKLTITMTTPPEAATNGDVYMSLVNSANVNGGNNSQSADQCTLITPFTNFSFVYGGITYTLKISYGAIDVAVGWVSGNTLGVYEGSTGTVDVMASFISTVPP